MKYLQSQIKDQVISGYLNGKTRDQIAKECGISTGTASTIIKEWKRRIKALDIEDLMKLAVLMKKSEMTIEKCSKGYRIYYILKSLGIEDIEGEEGEEGVDNLNSEINNHHALHSFVKETYFNCKKLGFQPYFTFNLM